MTFVVVYEFDVRPGHEDAFIEAWRAVTLGIREHRGGLGSRLMRGEGGEWIAHAEWPDRATWTASRKDDRPAPYEHDAGRMGAALVGSRIVATYDVVADETRRRD